MKQTMTYLKALSFLFAFLLVNSIYSQSACSGAYTFSVSGNTTTCNYTFTAGTFPHSPTVTSIDWRVYSTGTYGSLCYTGSGATWTQQFCFDGNYDVTMIVNFTGGSWCYVTHTNESITCTGAITCNPSPSRIEAIPDPVVEITYKAPYICETGQGSSTAGCMYTSGGSGFDIACGWTWALRIPITPYTCEPFTYYVEYTDAVNTDCMTFGCVRHVLDTNLLCITAKVNTLISVVATGNHCCLPSGYQRGYTWTPNYSSDHPIGPPTTTLGVCAAWRDCPSGHSGNCAETQYTMSLSSGWPSPPNCAITLVNQKIEQRKYDIVFQNTNIEQDVIIYTLQGVEIFNGKWKFGDASDLYLNWPKNIGSGLYLIRFQNSKKLMKLLKFD